MGFPRNLEKQDFIQLRLERDPRPGGRSKANARKYYGGVYHRMHPEARTREVEEWKAGKARGEEEEDGAVGEEVGEEAVEMAGAEEDATLAKDEGDEGAGTTESVQAHKASNPEPREGVTAPTATAASVQPADDQGVKPAESIYQHDDAAPEISAHSDAQPSPVADEYDATSTAIEHDETAQGDNEKHTASPTELFPAPTSSDAIPTPDEEDRNPEEAGEKEGVRADSVQPSSPRQPSAATNANSHDQDVAPAPEGTRQDSQNASGQEEEQTAPAAASLSAEDSGANSQPLEEDDDAALTSLEQEIEKALGGVHGQAAAGFPPRHSSIVANAASTAPQDGGEKVQDQDETDSLFVSEGEDEDAEEGLLNDVSFAQRPQDTPHLVEETDDNTAEVPSQQEQDTTAEFSADEGDDSDADDLLGLEDDDDDHEANTNDFNAEQQQDQEGLDFWPSSSNNYGAGTSNSFLPDDMLPELSPSDQPGPTPNAPEVPSMSSSAAQEDFGNEKKRKLSDGLSDLSPEVRAAFLDFTEGQAQGPSRWISGTATPDGHRQKKPRLNVRRPGQQGSSQPSPQEERRSTQPMPPPPSQQLTAKTPTETSTAGVSAPPEIVRQETETRADKPAKPSFLSSILNDTKTKPLYPGSRY